MDQIVNELFDKTNTEPHRAVDSRPVLGQLHQCYGTSVQLRLLKVSVARITSLSDVQIEIKLISYWQLLLM